MKKFIYGLLPFIVIVGLLWGNSSQRHYNHKDKTLNAEFDAIYYELGVVSRRSKIWWKNPNSWDIANNKQDVAISPSWITFDATAVTSADARYIYLLVYCRNSSADTFIRFRENGQSNSHDGIVTMPVAGLFSSSVFWQKLDSEQKFQYNTELDNEKVYIRCIAYME